MQLDAEGLVGLDVTAGPVRTSVTLTTNGAIRQLALEPGEHRRLELPPGLWRIATTGIFRPRDFDPSSLDARPLGARLEF